MTADRVRRWPKSVGTIASLLILAAAVATTRWTVTWTCQTWGMGIWDGSFALIDPSEHLGGLRVYRAVGSARRWAIYAVWFRHGPFGQRSRVLTVPLWVPFIAVAVPTARRWVRDCRSTPPGRCRTCRYDLMGIRPESAPSAANPSDSPHETPPARHPGRNSRRDAARHRRREPLGRNLAERLCGAVRNPPAPHASRVRAARDTSARLSVCVLGRRHHPRAGLAPIRIQNVFVGDGVVVPTWNITVLTGVLIIVLARFRRKPRPGVRRVCQYDLTGNVFGVCPECGQPAESRA